MEGLPRRGRTGYVTDRDIFFQSLEDDIEVFKSVHECLDDVSDGLEVLLVTILCLLDLFCSYYDSMNIPSAFGTEFLRVEEYLHL